jgi:hypothetical protein
MPDNPGCDEVTIRAGALEVAWLKYENSKSVSNESAQYAAETFRSALTSPIALSFTT